MWLTSQGSYMYTLLYTAVSEGGFWHIGQNSAPYMLQCFRHEQYVAQCMPGCQASLLTGLPGTTINRVARHHLLSGLPHTTAALSCVLIWRLSAMPVWAHSLLLSCVRTYICQHIQHTHIINLILGNTSHSTEKLIQTFRQPIVAFISE